MFWRLRPLLGEEVEMGADVEVELVVLGCLTESLVMIALEATRCENFSLSTAW